MPNFLTLHISHYISNWGELLNLLYSLHLSNCVKRENRRLWLRVQLVHHFNMHTQPKSVRRNTCDRFFNSAVTYSLTTLFSRYHSQWSWIFSFTLDCSLFCEWQYRLERYGSYHLWRSSSFSQSQAASDVLLCPCCIDLSVMRVFKVIFILFCLLWWTAHPLWGSRVSLTSIAFRLISYRLFSSQVLNTSNDYKIHMDMQLFS